MSIFDRFREEGKKVEKVKIRKPFKQGLIYQNNYRKRMKKNRLSGQHRKMMIYPLVMRDAMESLLKEKWVKDLDISSQTAMFVYAIQEGFINGKFKKEEWKNN
tara:strand:- start:263 stop:571 length:309 start_codon:yes stop_codon:yes gene_type:complete